MDLTAWEYWRGAAMTINLKPEQERIIQEEIESGHFKKHGRPAAGPRKNLAQFLMESPLAGAELRLERQKDYGRPIDLAEGVYSPEQV